MGCFCKTFICLWIGIEMGFPKIPPLGLVGLMVRPLEGFKVDRRNFVSRAYIPSVIRFKKEYEPSFHRKRVIYFCSTHAIFSVFNKKKMENMFIQNIPRIDGSKRRNVTHTQWIKFKLNHKIAGQNIT